MKKACTNRGADLGDAISLQIWSVNYLMVFTRKYSALTLFLLKKDESLGLKSLEEIKTKHLARVKGKKWQLRFLSQFVKRLEWVKRQKDSLKLFLEALKLYRSQNWNLAKMQLNNLQKQETQRYVYEVYIKRIAYFMQNLSEKNYYGVFN